MVQDLVLDHVQGMAADAGVGEMGMAFGSLRGKITRTAAAVLDAGGTVYITLHAQVPPARILNEESRFSNDDLNKEQGTSNRDPRTP